MTSKITVVLLIITSALFLSFKPLPREVAGAGIVEKQLEKEFEGQLFDIHKPMPPLQIDIPEEHLELPEGVRVYIGCVKICGNETFSTQFLEEAVQEFCDCDLCLKDIYCICSAIDRIYAERGYFLARAYPPEQTIEDGCLYIEVIEGKLGNVEVVGNRYYSTEFIQSYFAHLIGCPLQYDQFVRALLLVNDNRDLLAGAVFEKGREFGTGDVILRIVDERPVHLYLNGNNFGRDLTTNTRVGAREDWGNVFTDGDMFSIAEVIGFPVDALYFTDLSYTVPIGRDGASLGFEFLSSRFKIEELKALHLHGRSDIGTIRYNQALVRRRCWSADFFTYFDFKQIQNFALCHQSSFDKLRVLTFGGSVDAFDNCGTRNLLVMQFAFGIPRFLGGLNPIDPECSRLGGGGEFFRANLDYDLFIRAWEFKDTYYYVHASGQYSPNKLPQAEQFYIGGVDTVRGYPLAVALGDSGFYNNNEVRFPPPFFGDKCFCNNLLIKDIIQFDAFLDVGGYICGPPKVCVCVAQESESLYEVLIL